MSKYAKLLELLNADNPNPIPFDTTNISISEPLVDIGSDHNTKVTLSSISGTGFIGSVDVFYKRINLTELGTDIWLFSEVPFTQDIVMSILNTTRDAFLVVEDLEQISVPGMRVGDIRSIIFTAKNNSMNWIGQNSASIIIGFPGISNTLNQLMNFTLPSLGYLI